MKKVFIFLLINIFYLSANEKFNLNQKYVCINQGIILGDKIVPIMLEKEAFEYPIRIFIDNNSLHTDSKLTLQHIEKTTYSDAENTMELFVKKGKNYLRYSNKKLKDMVTLYGCVRTNSWLPKDKKVTSKKTTTSSNMDIRSTNSINTVSGKLEIIKIKDDYSEWVVFGKQILLKLDRYINFEKIFYLSDKTIVIIKELNDGTISQPFYYIIEISKDKKPYVSQYFDSCDWTFVAKKSNNKIIINLGYESKLEKYAIYENRKLEIKKIKPKKQTEVDDNTCNYLYNSIYLQNMTNDCANSDWSQVDGMSTGRPILYIENNPYFNLSPMERLCKEACKTHNPITYSKFRKKICKAMYQ